MADKAAEYRRTAQILRLLADQARFPDTGDQLRRLATSFEALADRVMSWDQRHEVEPLRKRLGAGDARHHGSRQSPAADMVPRLPA
jgi:hypothetical protein